MLDFLRRGVKSWVAKILLLLLIISFAVWGVGDIFLGRSSDTIATVGDTPVASDRFYREILRRQTGLTQQRGELVTFAEIRNDGTEDLTIQALLREAAYGEELSQRGIAIPDVAVRDTILADPRFQDSTGAFNQVNYEAIVSRTGFRPREFEALTRDLLGQQIIVDAVALGVPATPGLAETIAEWQGETRSVATLRLAAEEAADPGLPDDAALQTYFEANSDQFIEPERRTGSFLRTDIEALAAEMTPDDAELRAEYDANPDIYTAQAARTVEQIGFDTVEAAQEAADRIAAGEATWEEIAAEQNVALGDLPLGTVSEGELSEAADAAIFELTEPGIAGPVEGLFGALLMNVTEVQMGGLAPFDSIKERMRETTARFRAEERALEIVNQIDDIRAGGAEMEDLAAQIGLPLQRFEGLDRLGITAEGPQIDIAADRLFTEEVFEALDGEERDILELSDGSYILVMVETIAPSHLPELDTIRERVIAAWQQEQRLLTQEARAADLLAANGPQALEQLATQSLIGLTVLEPFTRLSPPQTLSGDLVERIFAANQGDLLIGRDRSGTGVLVSEVREVVPLGEPDLGTQRNAISDVLADSLSRDQLEYFARALEGKFETHVDGASVDYIFEQLSQSHGGGGGGM